MNHQHFLALLTSVVSATAILNGPLATQAQSVEPAPSAETETALVEPINIPFNPELDQSTRLPDDRQQSDNPIGQERVVVGVDERIPVLTRQFPWSAIGRLEWHYNDQIIGTCTATLIDSALVLTNSHCLTLPQRDSATGQTTYAFVSAEQYSNFISADADELKLVFKPSMINGVSPDEATVITYTAGWTEQSSALTEDWAVLELDEALGDRYGTLGWRTLDLNNADVLNALSENVLIAGYSGDFPTVGLREFGEPADTAGVDLQCSVLGVWPEGDLSDMLIHDCDTNPGASGAPILAKFADGNYYIIGLHAQKVELGDTVELPNGVRTQAVNGGVQVSSWSGIAFQMMLSGR